MGQVTRLNSAPSGNTLTFWCPACEAVHSIRVSGQGAWGWNGDRDKPTFTPSVLVTWPAHPDAAEEFKEWRTERRCHSFVKDGRIQFLTDCTHAMAGQTVDLPPLPAPYAAEPSPAA